MMGTRNLTLVKLNNRIKVAQYGQWDGYPCGQGATIAEFIQKKMNLKKLKTAIRNCSFASKSTEKKIDRKYHRTGKLNPEFSRDTGAEILEMIQDKGVRRLVNCAKFGNDGLFCEWAYLVNLDKKEVEVHRCGYGKDTLYRKYNFKSFTKRAMTYLQRKYDNE
jgi:hypothetical protein